MNREITTNLIWKMKEYVFEVKGKMSPDDSFKRVADDNFISGKDRRQLRKRWKNSIWFRKWAEKNPKLVPHLCW